VAILHWPQFRLMDTLERYLGSDPGGERVRSAANAATAVLAASGVVALLERLSLAFEQSDSVPGADVMNHAARLMVLMLGATVALVSSFVVNDATVSGRGRTSSIVAVGLFAGIALGVLVDQHRTVALVLLVAVPSVGAWFRRYGPRAFAATFSVHVGYLVGFLVGRQIGRGLLGWTAAMIAAAAVVTFAVGLAFLPIRYRSTLRMQRSYLSRARGVLDLTAALMDSAGNPETERKLSRRLRRRVLRLNETALVLDSHFAEDPDDFGTGAASATADVCVSANERRRRLFEHERAVAAFARLAERGAHDHLDANTRSRTRQLIDAARERDVHQLTALAGSLHAYPTDSGSPAARYRQAARGLAHVLGHHDAVSVPDYGARETEQREPHRGANLVGGWLPGSAIANALASSRSPRSGRWNSRIAMTVSTRVAVQLGVALTLAIVLGDLVSPEHVSWAVVAVYVTFLGSANDREQSTRALFRIAGTLLGVVMGDLIAPTTEARSLPALIVVILAAFFMIYFARINYALVVFAATIGVAQFYEQAGELGTTLLASRVEETALGAACAIVVGLCIVPLRTRHTAGLAVAGYLRALADVLGSLGCGNETTGAQVRGHRARSETRVLDESFHTAIATLRPLTRTLFGTVAAGPRRVLRLVDLSYDLSRTIVHDVAALWPVETIRLDASAGRASTIARALAEDLERPAGGVLLPTNPTEPVDLTRADRHSPMGNVYAEMADIEAALHELARLCSLSAVHAGGREGILVSALGGSGDPNRRGKRPEGLTHSA
jgi:hypothetical protein